MRNIYLTLFVDFNYYCYDKMVRRKHVNLLIFILIIVSYYILVKNTDCTMKQNTSSILSNKVRKQIFVWTLTNSGSSFLGDIFQNHKDVFYLYEPYQKVEKEIGYLKLTLFLLDLLNCNVDESRRDLFDRLINTGSHMYDDTTNRDCNKEKKCELVGEIARFEKTCKSRSFIVTKEILWRIDGGLERFTDLMKNRSQDIKIIHLLRDPRSMVLSSAKIGTIPHPEKYPLPFRKYLIDRCRQNLRDLEFGLQHLSHDQYTYIRYEDVLFNFDEEIDRVLSFTNLDLYEEYKQFLTMLKTGTYVKKNFPINYKKDFEVQLNKWRSKISHEILNTVEDECRDYMEKAGYKKVNGNWSLLEDTSISLVGKFNL